MQLEKIGKHISELLFDHDCVIVPALGGFLASNEPARLLPNRVLYPPYRRIAFNVYLKQNDGLLANHIVEGESISYSAANTLLEEFTFECIQHLEQGRKVNIAEVGTLYFDHEKNIQFEAFRNINHRKDAFGLEPVHVIPVPHNRAESKDRPSLKPVREPSRQRVFSKKSKIYIGAAAAIAAIVWFSANLYLVSPKKYEATSLNPFDSQALMNTESIITPEPVSNDTQKNDSALTADNTPVFTPPPADTTAVVQAVPETKEPFVTGPRHFVIAGVFKIHENALNLLSKLKSQGFPNAQLIESNDRNYVSYNDFDTYGEAIAMADSLRHTQTEGWIWKH